MHAYCLYCERQKCGRIAQLMELHPGIRCISPAIIQRKWVGKQCLEERHDWLPNYLFLYADEPLREKIWADGIIRWLGNGELEGSDLTFARMLYEQNGVLGTIHLVAEGDRCVINDPIWKNAKGRILKIEKKKKRCCLEINFDNIPRTIWLGYDMDRVKDS